MACSFCAHAPQRLHDSNARTLARWIPWHRRDRHGSMTGTRERRTGRERMAEAKERTVEDRIRAIEDRLAIYNLIASHPPSVDTGAQSYIRSIFADDGVLDLGGAKTAT